MEGTITIHGTSKVKKEDEPKKGACSKRTFTWPVLARASPCISLLPLKVWKRFLLIESRKNGKDSDPERQNEEIHVCFQG